MRPASLITLLAPVLASGLSACGTAAPQSSAVFEPRYMGVVTRLLDGDLVNFQVSMRGARGVADLDDYARCAAAQYALIRGYGFARHLRTTLDEKAGLWRADAIYTISSELPRGSKTIDAEVTVADCDAREIPTV